MKYFLFLSLIIFTSSLTGQINNIYINIDLSITQRISYKSNILLSQQEKNEIKDLEVFKTSPSIEISYLLKSNKQQKYIIGLGFTHLRFGSKKYKIPQDVPNITPQYNSLKQEIFLNQLFLSFESNYSISSLFSFFVKARFIKNDKLYKIYSASYDDDNIKRFPGILKSDALLNHKLDFSILLGVEYFPLKTTKFSLKPYLTYYLRPYTSTGDYFEYLYFEKQISGSILGIGISIQYLLNNKNSFKEKRSNN